MISFALSLENNELIKLHGRIMNHIKYFLFLIFIVLNINNVFADSARTPRSQQQKAEICGQRTCEFIFKEMRKFAKNGSPAAQTALSIMYSDGIGTEIDKNRSLKYIKKAANNGVSFAEYSLGMLYREGKQVGKFGKDAGYWLKRAAKANFKPAVKLLASERKILAGEVGNDLPIVHVPPVDENLEIIVITADKYTLTDFYDLVKSQGYGNPNQTGSRIKGQGCGSSTSPCSSWNTQSAEGHFNLFYQFLTIR